MIVIDDTVQKMTEFRKAGGSYSASTPRFTLSPNMAADFKEVLQALKGSMENGNPVQVLVDANSLEIKSLVEPDPE